MVGTLIALGVIAQSQPAPKPDPAAYSLLEKASMARQTMPANIARIEGDVQVVEDTGTFKGKFSYDMEDGTQVTADGMPEEVLNRLDAQISSIYGHRRSGTFAQGDGRHPLSFTGEEGPLGKRIALNDSLKSFYRVRGDEITEVDRVMGGYRFIISIVENTRTQDGKILPKHFSVARFDKDGKILANDVFTDEYAQVDGVWLIKSRRVISAKNMKINSVESVFSNMKLIRK